MFTRNLQWHTYQCLLGLQGLSSSFGTQCTAIAFVALSFASCHRDPSTSHHLDTIVFEENSRYRSIVRNQLFNGDVTTLLTHSDLSSNVTYFGAANYLPANADAGGHTLTNALHQALTPSSWFLATFGGTTIAIFRHRDQLFAFDSHVRNVDGFVDSDGARILIAFDSHTYFAEYLCQMYYNQVSNISL